MKQGGCKQRYMTRKQGGKTEEAKKWRKAKELRKDRQDVTGWDSHHKKITEKIKKQKERN